MQRSLPLPVTEQRAGFGPAQQWRCVMAALLIGYARCSTDEQDLTVQREGLASLVVTKLDRLARPCRMPGRSPTNSHSAGPAQPRRRRLRPDRPVGRLLFNVLAMVAEFSVISTRRVADLPDVRVAA